MFSNCLTVPMVSFESENTVVRENVGVAEVCLRLNQPVQFPFMVIVNSRTSGSAIAGELKVAIHNYTLSCYNRIVKVDTACISGLDVRMYYNYLLLH